MKLFNDFGFEPAFFAAQIVNFLILAFVFKKYMYKPVLHMLRERKRQIEKGIEDAEAAQVSLEKAEEKSDEIIKKATLSAEKIIDDTKKNAESLKDEIVGSAKKDADRIIAEAKALAAEEEALAKGRAEKDALDLAKKLLDKVLSDMFTRSEREKIMKRNISMLKDYE